MTEKFVKSNYDFYIQVNSSVFNLNIDFIKKNEPNQVCKDYKPRLNPAETWDAV